MKTSDYSPSSERLFKERGPFSHVCSKPVDGILFNSDEDRWTALVFLAMAAEETSTRILAYAIMSNHFHAIIESLDPATFYSKFRDRINLYLARHGASSRLPEAPTIVPIVSLNQLMDEVAYVIRNQFVVDKSINPLSHKWCSGYLYFNPMGKELADEGKYEDAASLSGRKIALLTFSREGGQPLGRIKLRNGVLAPSSFVDYRLVEQLFGTPSLFFTKLFRNVEAQVETALLLGETPVVPDEEMSRIIWAYCKKTWDVKGVLQLTPAQRIELAKHMKYTYRSSNGQIARITHLPRKDVETLFPVKK
jgi:hypothetical protein